MNKDYIFNINWEDRHKNIHKIGVLAQLDNQYYLIVENKGKINEGKIKEENNELGALPGFRPRKVYKSLEMFEFFKKRVLRTPDIDYCEELIKTGGKSMTDSFSVEKVSEEEHKEQKAKILETYSLQEKVNKKEIIE